jgi:cell division protein FtsB
MRVISRIKMKALVIALIVCLLIISISKMFQVVNIFYNTVLQQQKHAHDIQKINNRQLNLQSENVKRIAMVKLKKRFYGPGKTY